MRRAAGILALTAALASCIGGADRHVATGPAAAAAPAASTAPDTSGPMRLSVTSSRGLPSTVLRAARRLPGVIKAGPRKSGLVDLASVSGATHALPRRPAGTILPVSIEGQDPAVMSAFPQQAEPAKALAAGLAVLPKVTADLRGLDVGDRLQLRQGARRVTLTVGAVVEDGFRAEYVVPLDAVAQLGITRTRSITLAVAPERAFEVQRTLEELVKDLPARVRTPRPDTGFAPSGRRLLGLAQAKSIFGEFWFRPGAGIQISVDPVWRRRNIVDARIPLLGIVRCHRLIVPLLTGAMNELRAQGLAGLVRSFSGCYSPRMQVPNDEAISMHAFGIAVDINAASNPYGATPRQDPQLVEVMERWGFAWGGNWSVPDGMHFEFSAFPESATLSAVR